MVKGCTYLHPSISIGVSQPEKTLFFQTNVLVTDLIMGRVRVRVRVRVA